MPASGAALARGFSVEGDEVDPLVVEELTHSRLGSEDGIDEFRLAVDDHGEAARFVDEILAIVDGLEREDVEVVVRSGSLADQAVALVGAPEWKAKRLKFPQDFDGVPLVLPSFESNTREGFERLLASAGVRPLVMAEVDDMAMLRLIAREDDVLALVPPVVVQDEIASGALVVTHRIAEIRETFYAVTASRHFPNPLVGKLIEAMKTKGVKVARRRSAS